MQTNFNPTTFLSLNKFRMCEKYWTLPYEGAVVDRAGVNKYYDICVSRTASWGLEYKSFAKYTLETIAQGDNVELGDPIRIRYRCSKVSEESLDNHELSITQSSDGLVWTASQKNSIARAVHNEIWNSIASLGVFRTPSAEFLASLYCEITSTKSAGAI